MVKVTYDDQFVYKIVIWVFFGISLSKEKVALMRLSMWLGVICKEHNCSLNCLLTECHMLRI